MPHRLSLDCLDRGIEIESELPETSAWLTELVQPSMAEADVSAHLRIRLARRPRTEVVGSRVPCFAFDDEVISLPAVEHQGEAHIDDEFFRAVYVLRRGCATVSPRNDAHHVRGAALRALREAALSCTDWTGRVQLHAAAIAHDDDVVLLAGGAGGR